MPFRASHMLRPWSSAFGFNAGRRRVPEHPRHGLRRDSRSAEIVLYHCDLGAFRGTYHKRTL
jgi:hypothetical protein